MDIRLVKGFQYKVDLKDGAEAWYQPPRRTPPALKEELTDQFENEIKHGLLIPENSPKIYP